jgi:uncharacterized protein YdeI (YjbR/CyaY-like superfamily)
MKRAETVDEYIDSAADWKGALVRLRKILNSTELEETVKWGAPCYTIDGKNVVGVGAYKAYCGLWFFQGALLADKRNLLINAQDGKTKALRQWRFQSTSEIDARLIKAYVKEAIKPERVELLPELAGALRADKKTRGGFEALTPGKQREYASHIADAKREATKLSRLEKVLPMIRDGKGLHDKYRNC